MSAPVHNARPGRPASATREQALERAQLWLMEGRRLDLRALARELGVGRTTLYGWFGSREELISSAFARAARSAVPQIRAGVRDGGARGILETLRRYDRMVSGHPGIQALLATDPAQTIRVVTDPQGVLHRTHIELFERLITDEVAAGRYAPPIEISALAYALVALGEHVIFIEAQSMQPDLERLALVQSQLLGGQGRSSADQSLTWRP